MKSFLSVMLALVLVAGSLDAEAARRLGGGGSVGRQSSNVTQREATRTPPATTPAQQQSPAVQQAPATAGAGAAAAAQQRRPWGGILGGVAAGLGLAWLAHSLGLGAGFGQFLLLALLALVLFAVVAAVMRRRTPTQQGYAFPGGGPAPQDVAAAPPQYNPAKIGNDASARPWERSSMAFDAAKLNQDGQIGSNLRIGSGLEGSQSWGVPAGFDAAGFVESAKRNFITLQSAWDRGDIAGLRAMMTDEMLGETRNQLAQREREAPGQPSKTEVVMLEAQLLGIEELADEYMASVEFSGMIREDASAGPSPFREVWNMTKPKQGAGGWLVAGVQALQ